MGTVDVFLLNKIFEKNLSGSMAMWNTFALHEHIRDNRFPLYYLPPGRNFFRYIVITQRKSVSR